MMLRVGSRGSKLALWQANFVKDQLLLKFPELSIELVTIKTTGDIKLEESLKDIGGKGVFVKEIEEALLTNKIDIAVHSLKDVPSILPEGLFIGSVLKREDPRDCLISKEKLTLDQLGNRASRVGTGSLRRKFQLLSHFPNLSVVQIRGNIDTRIKKVENGDYDAVVLASAGIKRLGLDHLVTQYFKFDSIIPAPCQGIIGIECRVNDEKTKEYINKINNYETQIVSVVERSFLSAIGGDCNIPVGCIAQLSGDEIKADSIYINPDNGNLFFESGIGNISEPEKLGYEIALNLINKAT